jgi:enediyne biosynthesis protein E4
VGDFNLDGHLDILKTHFADDTAILYQNNGRGYFRDATIGAGLGVETRFVGWGAGIADLDNDGLPDLFFITGMRLQNAQCVIPKSGRQVRAVVGPGRTGDAGSA